MNTDPIQACNLSLDVGRLRDEVLQFCTSDRYGQNNRWSKIHLYQCVKKSDSTTPVLWSEINTPESLLFHRTLTLDDYRFVPNNSMDKCPCIKEILQRITDREEPTIYICDISILQKNGKVPTHRDQDTRPYMRDETIWTRFHNPIITSDGAYLIMKNKKYNLKEGILYKLRTTLPHSVINQSDTDRYHLIIDLNPRHIDKTLQWYTVD